MPASAVLGTIGCRPGSLIPGDSLAPPSPSLSPATASGVIGDSVPFTAANFAGPVTFSSGSTSVATINPTTGVATCLGVGTAIISATDGTTTRTAPLAVASAPPAAVRFLTSIAFSAARSTTPTVVPKLLGIDNTLTTPSGTSATAVATTTTPEGVTYSAVVSYASIPSGSLPVPVWTADAVAYPDAAPTPFAAGGGGGALDATYVTAGITATKALQILLAEAAGDLAGAVADGGTITIRDAVTGVVLITAACDGLGNRTVTLNLT